VNEDQIRLQLSDAVQEIHERNVKIKQLESEKGELIESYKELLEDAKYLYQYYPNNFRADEETYFKTDIILLQKHEVKP
jgi:hypothetical protein